jgi:class 3 adenylate cyclase/streptogramin lyase
VSGSTTLATVLFTDIVVSTEIAAEMGDRRWQELLRRHHALVRRELRRYRGKEIDTAGDGFFATFDRPTAGIRAACAIAEAVRELGVEVRAGVHVGEVEVRGPKVGGLAVHIGARVMGLAGPGEVLVTATTKDLVPGSGFRFDARTEQRLKGVPGTWPVFAVTSVDGRGRPAPPSPPVARERREAIQSRSVATRRWIPSLAAIVTLVLVAMAVVATGDDDNPSPPPGGIPLNSVVQIDPDTGKVLATVPGLPAPRTQPPRMAFGAGALWITTDPYVVHVDPEGRKVEGTIQVGDDQPIAVAFRTVWVGGPHLPQSTPSITRVDPATDQRLEPVHIPDVPWLQSASGLPSDIEVGEGAVWACFGSEGLVRIARDGEVTVLRPGGGVDAIAVGEGAVWLADQLEGAFSRLDPHSDTARPVADLFGNTDVLTAGEGYVWVLNTVAGTVTPIGPESGPRTAIRVGHDPTDLAVGLGAAWIPDEDGTITRIDAGTLTTTRFSVDGPLAAIALDDEGGTLWALVARFESV